MHEIRLAFLAAAGAARPIAGLADVAERWGEESALPRLTIGGLCAHLARAVTTVEQYLSVPPEADDDDEPLTAAAYFAALGSGGDLDSPANAGVRERAEGSAREGHHAVVDAMDRAISHLRLRLSEEPDDRLVRVIGDMVLPLDEYLVTRIVELTLHTDDLCVSVGHATPALPGVDLTIRTLVDVATLRHGEVAVLHALARRERDQAEALRVI